MIRITKKVKDYKAGDLAEIDLRENWEFYKHYIFSDHIESIVKVGNKLYFLNVKGKCEPNKCRSACCKIMAIDSTNNHNFSSNFGDFKFKNTFYINRKCKRLKNNKCTIHKRKSQPLACRLFPNFLDDIYWIVKDKCTKKIFIESIYDKKKARL